MANVSSSNGIEKYPKLRFPEFTEPWRDIKLSDVSSYRNKRTTVSKVKYVSTENMLQNYAGLEPYTEDIETDGIAIFCNDTLLANIRPYLKKVLKSEFNGACSTDVLAFSPEQINPDFLYSLIAQDKFIDYVMSGAKGSKMPRGDKSHIMDYATSIPTEEEQQKISSFVELINNRIAAQTYYIELLKKYKRGVVSKLLNGTLAFDNRSDMVLKKVGDFCEVQMCKRIFKEQTSPIGDVPFYKIGTIGGTPDAYISRALYDEYRRKYSFPRKGEFLISCAGTVGKCVLYNGEDSYYQDSNIVWLRNNSVDVTNEYLYMLVSNVDWSTLNSTTITRIYNDNLRDLSFHIPPVPTQKRITSFVFALVKRIDIEQEMLEKFLQEKAGLLQQLFI